MIRVMIVDDEPFIRQGIQILINWEQYGFKICGEVSNGKEAIDMMKDRAIDLIITDIKMPEMNGIELIEYTYNYISPDIQFILLSGYYEFEYAKKAIQCEVVDYILKPVQKEELVRILEDYKKQYNKYLENKRKLEFSEKIVFDSYLSHLIAGKKDIKSNKYINRYLAGTTSIRYIKMEYYLRDEQYNKSIEEQQKDLNYVYDILKNYLVEHWFHSYINTNTNEMEHSVDFIYAKKLADLEGISESEYIKKLYHAINSRLSDKIIFYIGQKVDDINQLSDSYRTANIAKSFRQYSNHSDMIYYDEMKGRIKNTSYLMDKGIMDDLIQAIEEYDTDKINIRIEGVYTYFQELIAEPNIIKIYLDYLFFHLINLAKELKPELDQKEVNRIILQTGYNHMMNGSMRHLKKFALEFADYLSQIRQYAFGGVLKDIEKEIVNHYMDNLSLKNLSDKYYMNCAYLGQTFKKQYGISFKDYLNNYRIERAAELLIRSDIKIYEIANAVGFNSTDYFISKFVEFKGITPLQYRKQVVHSTS